MSQSPAYRVIKTGEIGQLIPCPCDTITPLSLSSKTGSVMPSSYASWSRPPTRSRSRIPRAAVTLKTGLKADPKG